MHAVPLGERRDRSDAPARPTRSHPTSAPGQEKKDAGKGGYLLLAADFERYAEGEPVAEPRDERGERTEGSERELVLVMAHVAKRREASNLGPAATGGGGGGWLTARNVRLCATMRARLRDRPVQLQLRANRLAHGRADVEPISASQCESDDQPLR